jgi:hypothetical protein
MEAVGQRMKSAYDMYLPYEDGTTPPADACYGGEWHNITFFKSDVTAVQESAYFCFPKNGEICVQNPFNQNDTEACFSLQNFQNSGVAQVEGLSENQIAKTNLLRPNIDVAKSWNISSEQLQKWQTAKLPVFLQMGAGNKAHADIGGMFSLGDINFSNIVSSIFGNSSNQSNNQSDDQNNSGQNEPASANGVANTSAMADKVIGSGRADDGSTGIGMAGAGGVGISATRADANLGSRNKHIEGDGAVVINPNNGANSIGGINPGGTVTGAGQNNSGLLGSGTGSQTGFGNGVGNGSHTGIGSGSQSGIGAGAINGSGVGVGTGSTIGSVIKIKNKNKNPGIDTPQPWLATPTNAPEIANTAEVSKENIDMTCDGMNKCVKFTACLSKNCDNAKQVSQLFAFKSPRSKTVFPTAKSTLTKSVDPTDELCWSAPESEQLGVKCTLTGPCTTEGAEGGECTGGIYTEFRDIETHRMNARDIRGADRGGQPPTQNHIQRIVVLEKTGSFSLGKAQCVRKAVGSCSGEVLSCEDKVITAAIPGKSCHATRTNEPCSVDVDLATLKEFEGLDFSHEKEIIVNAKTYINRVTTPACAIDRSLTIDYGKESANISEGGKKSLNTEATIKGTKLTVRDYPMGWGGARGRGCVNSLKVTVKLRNNSANCVAKREEQEAKIAEKALASEGCLADGSGKPFQGRLTASQRMVLFKGSAFGNANLGTSVGNTGTLCH